MKIQPHTVATIVYQLHISDQDQEQVLVEIVTEEDPMTFLVGESGLPEKFEAMLMGKQAGDTFEFSISPQEGYGEYDPEAIEFFPLKAFEVDGQPVEKEFLQVGNVLPLTNQEGEIFKARVERVTEEGVWLDFNHPLAGKTMHFTGQVIHVRQATGLEIEQGQIHHSGEMTY
ncbi:MAG: FKBP-type peptidyl-prolyl cis-trans isomerase [Cytophagales bacterium]|nr:FKBP-type peptidyl-prolyl cis-trans isomerase [Bernardetiaceae bacterium]MDW8211784.1 FKBP-type peptidyl-prolyl cis-trans isomerase [Cytophagales bacterium]